MKTLKTLFTVVLSLALCATMLCACQPSKPDPQDGSDTTTTTTEAITTTTEAVTTTTEASTTTEPANVFTINEDRLSEIGKSYAELQNQYGKPLVVWGIDGGVIYWLENSNCAYYFGEHDWEAFSQAPRNNDGSYPGETAPRPSDDVACEFIYLIRANQLFNNLAESVSPTELAEMYGLEHLLSEQIMFYQNNPNGEYMSTFRYGKYEILIHAHEDYLIGPDSMIRDIKIAER